MKKPPCGSPFELPSDCGGLSVLWAAVQKAKKNPAGRGAVRDHQKTSSKTIRRMLLS